MAKAVVMGLVALALACASVVLAHAGEEVYAVPGWGVTVAIALAVLALGGGALILRSGAARIGAILTGAVAFALFGVLAIMSLGVLALAAAAVLLTWASRAPARTPLAAAGAVMTGVALPVLAVFALAGPVVECHEDGAQAGENIFLSAGSGEATGGVTSTPEGRSTGRAASETYEYSYSCDRGRLVEFELRRR